MKGSHTDPSDKVPNLQSMRIKQGICMWMRLFMTKAKRHGGLYLLVASWVQDWIAAIIILKLLIYFTYLISLTTILSSLSTLGYC